MRRHPENRAERRAAEKQHQRRRRNDGPAPRYGRPGKTERTARLLRAMARGEATPVAAFLDVYAEAV